ncbi:MAG TPA: hypothetical protein VFK85_00220 [Anaeromyxobacteraceae bacterium]|nr:hypothetical protein [Anaeromyxobacteraceae bacterium]
MDIKSYLRRSSSSAEIVASIAFYAGAEVFQRAATNLKRAVAGIGALVNTGSNLGQAAVNSMPRND